MRKNSAYSFFSCFDFLPACPFSEFFCFTVETVLYLTWTKPTLSKGGLVSESYSLWFKSSNKGAKSLLFSLLTLLDSREDSHLAYYFLDLIKSEKNSEINQTLTACIFLRSRKSCYILMVLDIVYCMHAIKTLSLILTIYKNRIFCRKNLKNVYAL